MATGSNDNSTIIWALNNGSKLFTLSGHISYVMCVAISSDNTKVISGSLSDASVIIWDLNNGSQLFNLTGHNGGISCIVISSDNTRVVTGSSDNTAIIWDLSNG